jgi:hypothetical protein
VKRIASIGLIIVLSIQCFYKLGIIGYFQLNQEYIAEVLCINKEKPLSMCQGQCFLSRNLDLGDNPEKLPLPVGKEKIEIPNFLISESTFSFKALAEPVITNSAYTNIYRFEYAFTAFHPPCPIEQDFNI